MTFTKSELVTITIVLKAYRIMLNNLPNSGIKPEILDKAIQKFDEEGSK